MNLPAGVAGAIVSIADYDSFGKTNALTVSTKWITKNWWCKCRCNLNTEGSISNFFFVDSHKVGKNIQDSTSNETGNKFIQATGGTITNTCGNFRIHTFTGPGTLLLLVQQQLQQII